MANNRATPSGIPVVIDEWTVQLWADSRISRDAARRLVALVAAELTRASTRLSTRLAKQAGGGAAARVEVAPR